VPERKSLALSSNTVTVLLKVNSFHVGYDPTPQGLHHAAYLYKVGAGFGFITLICGWIMTILVVLQSTGVTVPLPMTTVDLVKKIRSRKTKTVNAEQDAADRV
jgi:hypothetical protein